LSKRCVGYKTTPPIEQSILLITLFCFLSKKKKKYLKDQKPLAKISKVKPLVTGIICMLKKAQPARERKQKSVISSIDCSMGGVVLYPTQRLDKETIEIRLIRHKQLFLIFFFCFMDACVKWMNASITYIARVEPRNARIWAPPPTSQYRQSGTDRHGVSDSSVLEYSRKWGVDWRAVKG